MFYEKSKLANSKNIEIEEVITQNKNGKNAYYIFNFKKGGFAIISAYRGVQPILGFGLQRKFELQNMPLALNALLKHYQEQIEYAISSKQEATEEVKAQWQKYKVDMSRFKPTRNVRSVQPLLQTEWNQSAGWNSFCPANNNGPGGHTPAGCVAVAMAQVLKYWNCRIRGSGSHSYTDPYYGEQSANFGLTYYDWSNMANSSSTNATAELIYHCGVAVDTKYSTDGSSAVPWKIDDAMNDYFGCINSDFRWKTTNAIGWKNDLKYHLNRGRPIIYSGGSFSLRIEPEIEGHAWVVDGYDSDWFHMNWGWSGNWNDWFVLNDLTPNDHNFNWAEGAVFGIQPEAEYKIGDVGIILPNETCGDQAVLEIDDVDQATMYNWTTDNGTIVPGNTAAYLFANGVSEVCVTAVNERCNGVTSTRCQPIVITNNIPQTPFAIYEDTPVGNPPTLRTFFVNEQSDAISFNWQIIGPAIINKIGERHVWVSFNRPGYYQLRVQAQNPCGTSGWITKDLYIDDLGGGGLPLSQAKQELQTQNHTDKADETISTERLNEMRLDIFPNPAKSSFIIRLSNNIEIQQVSIIDMQGRTVKKYEGNRISRMKIPTEELNNGIYIIKVQSNIKTYKEKIQITH